MSATSSISLISTAMEVWLNLVDAIADARIIRSTGQNDKYVSSVHNCRDRKTREPVDHVYALLGLDGPGGAFHRQNLRIDYSLPAKRDFVRLYINFAKLVLVRQSNLFLLAMTSSRTRLEGLPSWCPNLNSPDETYGEVLSHYRAGWPRRPPVDRGTEPLVKQFRSIQCSSAETVFTFPPSSLRIRSESRDALQTQCNFYAAQPNPRSAPICTRSQDQDRELGTKEF